MWSISSIHRSDAKVSGRYLIDVDPSVFAILGCATTKLGAPSSIWHWTNAFLMCHCFIISKRIWQIRFADRMLFFHYDDVIMTTIAPQITSLTSVYSTVYSDADQRKHQSSASLAFVLGNSPGPVNSPHKWPVTRKMFPFDDVIMSVFSPYSSLYWSYKFITGP